MKKLRSMEFLLSLMVVSSIQVILLRLLQPVVMYVCSEVFLQDVMKHLVHLSCSREENTKYTEAWVLSQLWKTEAKTDISRQVQRSWFRKALKDELHIRDLLKIQYSSLWVASVQVWAIVEHLQFLYFRRLVSLLRCHQQH